MINISYFPRIQEPFFKNFQVFLIIHQRWHFLFYWYGPTSVQQCSVLIAKFKNWIIQFLLLSDYYIELLLKAIKECKSFPGKLLPAGELPECMPLIGLEASEALADWLRLPWRSEVTSLWSWAPGKFMFCHSNYSFWPTYFSIFLFISSWVVHMTSLESHSFCGWPPDQVF